jgi:hypothetical protein
MSRVSRGGPVAQSLYRQFRVTCTQEIRGQVTYSIYAKGLNDSWKEQHCLVRDRLDIEPTALLTTEDVVRVLINVLREQVLPGSID